MTAPDVVVVGAGIVGVSTADALVTRGARVTLIDRAGVSEGTTGLGEGNVLCSDKDVGPELDLTVLGLDEFDVLEARFGEELRIRRKGALIVHPDASTWVLEAARAERLVAAGVPAEVLESGAAAALEPELTGPHHGATFVPGDLQCDPRAVTLALAREAEAAGARIRTEAEVTAITTADGRVTGVRLRGGEELAAGAVVLAAGAWSAPLARDAGLELPVEPRKGQLVRLRMPTPDPGFLRRKLVDGGYLRSLTSPAPERELSTVVETTWDGHVLVGSSRERCGFDPAVHRAVSTELQRRAARLVPAVAGLESVAAWVGFRPWLPDHLPAIGPSRRVEGLWVATGHEGAGIALGPVTGRLLAAALTGAPPAMDLAPFDPDRFA